jgi:hypothetical protein
VFVVLAALGMAQKAEAVPFLLTATLTGDPRPENPDNLLVHVTVTGDTTSNLTFWTVDLDSPSHPDLMLGGFFFNVANPLGTTLTFLNVSPSEWSIASTTQNAQGSGGAHFEFRSLDPPGPTNNVTNSRDLTFTAQLNGALWASAMLTNAELSDGAAITDPGAQLGTFLKAAVSPCSTAGCTDAGFAAGNWGEPARTSSSVPEPTTLLVTGLGLLGMAAFYRRSA